MSEIVHTWTGLSHPHHQNRDYRIPVHVERLEHIATKHIAVKDSQGNWIRTKEPWDDWLGKELADACWKAIADDSPEKGQVFKKVAEKMEFEVQKAFNRPLLISFIGEDEKPEVVALVPQGACLFLYFGDQRGYIKSCYFDDKALAPTAVLRRQAAIKKTRKIYTSPTKPITAIRFIDEESWGILPNGKFAKHLSTSFPATRRRFRLSNGDKNLG